jgi:ectoine hydroxylase-related dioxygenase (phytanoyl-CoA dioxygenase family)
LSINVLLPVEELVKKMNTALNTFETKGYIGPFKLFTEDQCKEILTERLIPGVCQTWNKSTHEQSGHVVKTAAHPFIKDKIIALLGNDILLWSSQFIKQKPGQKHVWHMDVEPGEGIPDGSWKGVTLWLGLKNLNHKTTLSLITHSHLLDTAPRELMEKKYFIK